MLFTVIGFGRKIGEYENKPFDNTYVHCTRGPITTQNEQGVIAEIFKIKTDLFNTTGLKIGDKCQPMYDKFGRCTGFLTEK